MRKSKTPLACLRDWLVSGEPPHPRDSREAEALAGTAGQQGLAGLLRGVIGPADPWPALVRDGLRQAHRAALARGVRQLDLAARILALLEREGVRALPLKGAALAEALYASVADRPMADIDLLVLDDWPSSVRLVRGQGFREVARADHAQAFVDPQTGATLELHHSLTSCPGLFPLDREALWSRSRTSSGQVHRLPGPEDLLVQLSLHAAFQHGLVLSLVQYLDFRRLLERSPIDPEQLRAIASASRAETVVAAALAAAEAVVGAPVPAELASLLGVRPPALARGLAAGLRDPLAFVVPAVPELARVRWGLLAGRRLDLVRRTVLVHVPGPRAPLGARIVEALRRAMRLVVRWTVPSWRAWARARHGVASGDGLHG